MNEEIKAIDKEEEKIKELQILTCYEADDRIISSVEMLEVLGEQETLPTFSSQYQKLDELIGGGWRPGELITITGITKHGKTCFARNLCSNLVSQNINSVFFSYEETERELLEKFPEPRPLFYLPKKLSSAKIDWISERVGEAVAKYGIKAVFLDNLDFVISQDLYKKFGNISDLIKFVVLDLKNMARHWGVSVFLLCHTTQEGMKGNVDIGNLKGSSSIAQISDFVLVVKRLKNKDTGLPGNKSKIQVLANRRTGRTGEFRLEFKNNKLIEIQDEVKDCKDFFKKNETYCE